jgi:spermidine synthase
MSLRSYIVPIHIYQSSSVYNRDIQVHEENGAYTLLVNGIHQTGGYAQRLWKKGLLPLFAHRDISFKSILVLGVGGGAVFKLFRKKFPTAYITGVDIDKEILTIGKTYFGLDTLPDTKLVCADAKQFVRQTKQRRRYDLIIVDLYTGNDVPGFVTQKVFVKHVRGLLRPHGRAVINYFREKDQAEAAQKLYVMLSEQFSRVQMKPTLRNIFFYVLK